MALMRQRGYGLAVQAERQQQAERRAWKEEAEELRLRVPAGRLFGCEDLPHYAVALAELDCRVEVHDSEGYSKISRGRVTFPTSRERLETFSKTGFPTAAYDAHRQTYPGQFVTFRVEGLDAKKALPIIEDTFNKGREKHLAVLRRYVRMKEEEDGVA